MATVTVDCEECLMCDDDEECDPCGTIENCTACCSGGPPPASRSISVSGIVTPPECPQAVDRSESLPLYSSANDGFFCNANWYNDAAGGYELGGGISHNCLNGMTYFGVTYVVCGISYSGGDSYYDPDGSLYCAGSFEFTDGLGVTYSIG